MNLIPFQSSAFGPNSGAFYGLCSYCDQQATWMVRGKAPKALCDKHAARRRDKDSRRKERIPRIHRKPKGPFAEKSVRDQHQIAGSSRLENRHPVALDKLKQRAAAMRKPPFKS